MPSFPFTQNTDREDILNTLIKGHQNIALIGFRKAGKTSLFEQFLTKQENYLATFYSIGFEETFSGFCFNYFNSISFVYLKSKNISLSIDSIPKTNYQNLLTLLSSIRPDLSHYLVELKNINFSTKDKGDKRGILSVLFELPYKLYMETEKPFIVILDEFQNVADFGGIVTDVLREKIQTKQNVFYYVAGSEVGLMNDLVNKYNTPLFGHFSNFRIGNFAYEDARQFALYLSKQKGIIFNEGLLNYLISLTGGFPFYIRVLVSSISDIVKNDKREFVEKNDLLKALEISMFDKNGILYTYFSDNLDISLRRRKSGQFYEILKSIATKPMSITEISNLTSMPVTSIPQYMDILMKTELIDKQNTTYFIKDSLMQFWLNASFSISESSVLDMETKLDNFNTKVKQLIEGLKRELGLAREAQIREIFILCGDYKRITSGYLMGQELDIIAESENGYLVGEIKSKNVVKADVEKFLNKLPKLNIKIQNIIFVYLMSIERDAINFAKNNDIELWDLQKVNAERLKYKLTEIKI